MISVMEAEGRTPGVTFKVLHIPKGERPPHYPAAVSDKEGTVEFYDARYASFADFTEHGQFTGGRYYVSTLLAHPEGVGLCLHGGVPEWEVTAEAMTAVLAWLRELEA